MDYNYNETRTKDVLKKAETIQKYFNKISVTRTSDLQSGGTKDDDVYTAFGSYKTSLEGFTSIDQSRIQRYREYEQMAYVPELNAGLELYADDASLYNEDDRVVEVTSDNQEVVDTLEDLWFNSLDLTSNLWHIIYNTCKYGEAFYEIIPDNFKNPKKVKFIRYIPPHYVARQEQDGNLLGFLVRVPPESTGATYSMSGDGEEIFLKPWQIVHFKLDDKEFDPYGKSVLENGRLAFKQMKLIEDAMLIYRITRAPERRIFNIPVGQLPYREAMQKVEDFKQRYRKTPWIDPTCTSLDTEIPLLNGEVKSLEELIEDYNYGKKIWVYSIDRDNGNQVVPGEILWAGVTRKNAKVLKITLDDGQTFKFTPDHKFLMRDGSYKEAQYLKEGDSIMPLYSKKTKKGYRSVYNPKSSKYYPRYMMSAKYTNSNLWNSNWEKRVVHHVDFDKENDYPENLKLMESKEHASYHIKLNHQLWQDPKFRSKINKAIKKKWQDPNFREMMSENTSERNKENWQDPEYREYMSNAISEGLKKYHEENPEKANEWYEFIKQFDTPENRKKNADSIRETYKNKEYSDEEREYFRQKSKEFWENNPERKEEYSERMSSTGKQYGYIGARLRNKFYSLDLEIDYQTWKESLSEEKYNKIIEGIQIDDIIDGAIKFNTRKQVAEYLDCNPGVILNRLYENGYSNWEEFYGDVNGLENKEDYIRSAVEASNNPKELKTIIGCSLPTAYKYFNQYKSEPVNHKIVSIEEEEEAIDTGTLTINHYHNFAIGRQDSGIFVKNSGEINYKANPLSINDDFFLPQRPDGTGVKIDTMQGGQQLGEIDDVRYFKEKILRTMRIPLSYLTGEMQGDMAKTSLAAMDVRFAKTIERIQKMIIKGLEKLSIIELAFKRFRIDDMYDFQLKLTTPSKIYEMQELETLTQKLNVIQTAMGLVDDNGKPYLPKEWLYKHINNFTEKEISNIKLMQQTEMIEKMEDAKRLELMQQQGATSGEAGGGEVPGGEVGGPGGPAEVPVGGGEEAGGEEAGGGEAAAAAPPGEGSETEPAGAAAEAGGAEIELASRILNVAGNDFLLENEDDIREVINFVKQQGENHKITKDNNKYDRRRKRIYENSFNQLFIRGEFKGLIRRRKKSNNVLKD